MPDSPALQGRGPIAPETRLLFAYEAAAREHAPDWFDGRGTSSLLPRILFRSLLNEVDAALLSLGTDKRRCRGVLAHLLGAWPEAVFTKTALDLLAEAQEIGLLDEAFQPAATTMS